MVFKSLIIVSLASFLIVADASDIYETVNDDDYAALDDFNVDIADDIDIDVDEEVAEAYQCKDPCPEKWWRLGNRCFRFFGEEKTWEEAAKVCKDDGGYLASIHSAEESERLFKMWKSLVKTATYNTQNAYWIGFSDAASEGKFQWRDCSQADYTNWYPNQPDNGGGNQDCALVWNKGSTVADKQKWDDQACSNKRSFFCSQYR